MSAKLKEISINHSIPVTVELINNYYGKENRKPNEINVEQNLQHFDNHQVLPNHEPDGQIGLRLD